jgi:transposase
MTSVTELPNDVELLKALVLEKDRKIIELTSMLTWSEEKLRAWELRYFGPKSEKSTVTDDKQNRLFDEAEANSDDAPAPVVEKVIVPAHERKKGRKPKVDTLPVQEVVYELGESEKACPCCGNARPEIGEERTSEYDLVPAHLVKIVHIRKKYGPCSCANFGESHAARVIAAEGPAKIVKGSDFTNRTIAFFLTGKYADAIPFYRMTKVLDRAGLVISRATLCNLAVAVGRSISDLIEAMNRDISASQVMLMDETTVQVLKKGEGPPGKSYMWVAVGYREGKPIKRFAYHASRSGSFADEMLKGFSGYLQTDGYSGYTHLEGVSGITRVGCFAHIRRRFVEAWEVAGKQGRAHEAIDLIAKIYRVERECREALDKKLFDEVTFVRRRKAELEPVFVELRDWLLARTFDTVPKSKLGQAVVYAQGQFDAAIRFAEHLLLTPDTNMVENAIRPFVIGRKNWLFSGSPRGAHSSAGLYSLVETAKANGHEPYKYLVYLFDNLPRCSTQAEKEALLPYRRDPSSYTVDAE